LSIAEKEPPQAKALRDLIAARQKKGLHAPDMAPWTKTGNDTQTFQPDGVSGWQV
jgi:hypothetical protein